MGETFRLVIDRGGQLLTLVVVLALPTALAAAAALYYGLRDVVLIIDETDNIFEVQGFEATSAVVMAVAVLVNVLASFVLSAAVARHAVFARTDRAERWNESLQGGLRRAPRVLGVTILVALAYVLPVAVLIGISIPMPALLLITLPAIIVGTLWFWVRMTFATTAAAVAPRERASMSVSLRLSKGVFGALLGRLCLLVLVVIGAQLASTVITAPLAAWSGNPTPIAAGDTEIRMIDLFGGNAFIFGLQQVIGSLVGGFVACLYGAGMAILYLDLGGPLDEEYASPLN